MCTGSGLNSLRQSTNLLIEQLLLQLSLLLACQPLLQRLQVTTQVILCVGSSLRMTEAREM